MTSSTQSHSDAVNVASVSKRFKRRWALRDCSFSIPQSSVAALVGPNGAGKSTLLRLLAGLDQPTSGRLTIGGLDAILPWSAQLLGRVAYVDQDRPLHRDLSVGGHIRWACDMDQRFDAQSAATRLQDLDIPLDRRVTELSGGQRAQVALVLALARRPEILILDEPTASLDPVARQDVLRLLLTHHVTHSSTVLVSTHDIAELETVFDYLILLREDGVLLADHVDYILGSHRFLTGAADATLPRGCALVHARSTSREQHVLVHMSEPMIDPGWTVQEPTLEEIVLAYLRSAARRGTRS